jgi:hypothetical protein
MEFGLGGCAVVGHRSLVAVRLDTLMIIAVTGWRYHTDDCLIRETMNELAYGNSRRGHDPEDLVVRGGDATGADDLIEQWCLYQGIAYDKYVADHYPSGALMPGAGPARNRRVLTMEKHVKWPSGEVWYTPKRADLLVGFPEPGAHPKIPGSGSWNCIGQAFTLGIEILIPANIKIGE